MIPHPWWGVAWEVPALRARKARPYQMAVEASPCSLRQKPRSEQSARQPWLLLSGFPEVRSVGTNAIDTKASLYEANACGGFSRDRLIAYDLRTGCQESKIGRNKSALQAEYNNDMFVGKEDC